MKRTSRLTALVMVLLMLVNISASATTTGIPLGELDYYDFVAMTADAMDAAEDENVLSEPCSDTNQYCELVTNLVALPTAQERYDYMMGLYSETDTTLEGTMLHYFYYKTEHNAEGLVCECAFPSLAPEYQPGALDVHEESCPWAFANLSVAEQYAVVAPLVMSARTPYIATLNADQAAALETYTAQQEGTLSYPCAEKPEYCQFAVYSQYTASELYDYFNKIYADENGEISELYAAMMLHYGEYHLDSKLICTCGEHPLPLPEYQIGDISKHDAACPWHFANLTVAEQYSVVCMMTADEQQPYLATLSAEKKTAYDSYVNEQLQATTPCDGTNCLYAEIKNTPVFERHAKLCQWKTILTETNQYKYADLMDHIRVQHSEEEIKEICLCFSYTDSTVYSYGSLYHSLKADNGAMDFADQYVDCPWHFSQLPSADRLTVFAQMTADDQQTAFGMLTTAEQYQAFANVSDEQKTELQNKYPEATGKLENVNKTEQTVTSNGSNDDEPSTDVAIKVPEGAFDVDYIMNAAVAVLNEAQQAAVQALEGLHQLAVFDISFEALADGSMLKPKTPVLLSFTIDTTKLLGTKLHVHHLKLNSDGAYTAEPLDEVAVDRSQPTQTVTVECTSFSAIALSSECDGWLSSGGCGFSDFLAITDPVERAEWFMNWLNDSELGVAAQYYNFTSCASLYHKDRADVSKLVCLCTDSNWAPTIYPYGSLDHDDGCQDFNSNIVPCPWHFDQLTADEKVAVFPELSTGDQHTILNRDTLTEEEKTAYTDTLPEDALSKLNSVNAPSHSAASESASVQINIPDGVFDVPYIPNATTTLSDQQLDATKALEGVKAVAAFDIYFTNLNDETQKLTPSSAIELSFAIDTSALEGSSLQVYHLVGDETTGYTVEAVGNASAVDRSLTTQTITVQASNFSVYFTGETCDGTACDMNNGQTYSYEAFSQLTTDDERRTYLNALYGEGTETDLEIFLLHLFDYHPEALEQICTCTIFPIPEIGSAEHSEGCPWLTDSYTELVNQVKAKHGEAAVEEWLANTTVTTEMLELALQASSLDSVMLMDQATLLHVRFNQTLANYAADTNIVTDIETGLSFSLDRLSEAAD